MSKPSNKRDPPSAASIILSNEDTPTFSLNARQLDILSNRERNRTEDDEKIPFTSRSNRKRIGMDPTNTSEIKKETRSLFPGRSRNSLVSGGSHAKTSMTSNDGGILRRILEQANQNARLSSRNRHSPQFTGLPSSVDRDQQTQFEAIEDRGRITSTSRIVKEPDDASTIREDPVELRPSNIHNQSAESGDQRNIARVAVIRESVQNMETKDLGSQNIVSGKTDGSGLIKRGIKEEDGHSVISVSSKSCQDDSEAIDETNRKNERQESTGAVSSLKIAESSVRRKLEDKKRLAQVRSKQKRNLPTSNIAQRATNSKELVQGKVASDKTRQLIREKMRHRKGISGGKSRELETSDDGFETFCQTLQHEATLSNSQVSPGAPG